MAIVEYLHHSLRIGKIEAQPASLQLVQEHQLGADTADDKSVPLRLGIRLPGLSQALHGAWQSGISDRHRHEFLALRLAQRRLAHSSNEAGTGQDTIVFAMP